jgi:autophagy-related protein 9
MYSFFHFLRDSPRLIDLHNFYHYLLGISDKDLQTATWPYVVGQIMELRDENPATARPERLSADNRRFINGQSKQRMDAHDIANRLMRKENYLIAIINRDILDCTVHIPLLGKRHFFSKTIEWNIGLAVIEYVFDENGQIRQPFLSSRKRNSLIEGMKRRFFLVGCMNLIISPIIVIFFLINQFLTSFTVSVNYPGSQILVYY